MEQTPLLVTAVAAALAVFAQEQHYQLLPELITRLLSGLAGLGQQETAIPVVTPSLARLLLLVVDTVQQVGLPQPQTQEFPVLEDRAAAVQILHPEVLGIRHL